MIEEIKSIDKLGIYDCYVARNGLNKFKKYNLFYGWNGSGKTTISKLFRMLEKKEIYANYSQLKFNIFINGIKITEKKLEEIKEQIYVFNEDFVTENIDWNNKINKILLLSKDKIEDAERFNNLKIEIEGKKEDGQIGLREKIINDESELNELKQNLEDINSRIARNIKNNMTILDSLDRKYSSYNKRNIQNTIDDVDIMYEIKKISLSNVEIEKLIQNCKMQKKEKINSKNSNFEEESFKKILESIDEIFKKPIVAKVIDRLKDNSDISSWVESGLELNRKYNNEYCDFCGGKIEKTRIEELENHFNDEVSKIKTKLEEFKTKLKGFEIEKNEYILEADKFYEERNSDIIELNKNLMNNIQKNNEMLENINKKISEKIENVFIISDLGKENKEDFFENIKIFNGLIELKNQYILESNQKTQDFENIINSSKRKLEMFYLKEQFELENLDKKRDELQKLEKEFIKKREEFQKKRSEFTDLEGKLSNETLGAEQFNKKLNIFLGYDEIKLIFNKDLKGYEIIRKDESGMAENLSEGEKTAIAFTYFLTKIKENGNTVENSIIVIDDPISSFDNNKLFNTYASIKCEFKNAKQLFILTHNFNFFKFIRDWMKTKKNKKTQEEFFSIYKIEPEFINSKRLGSIYNAGKPLMQTSEYDYIFNVVYDFKDVTLTNESLFLCGNACRKLLEAFLSFKFPKQRGNIQSLLDKAFKEDELIKNKVYKFINAYSHFDAIETSDDLDIDLLLIESSGIVNIILNKIKVLDEEHYNAMELIANEK